MTGLVQTAGRKRKINYDAPSSSSRSQKRHKGRDAREISSQTADKALSATGDLNITSYVKAREFEINALDKSMRKSRKGLMSRAFQQLPRHMRRRTASHNVKKVPRRLRKRAGKEMKEDNTPTVNSKTRTPSSKLRLRLETAKKLKALNNRRKNVRQKRKETKDNTKEPEASEHVSVARLPRLKKNKLAGPPKATSKFKRRQVNKTWLPTHLWHTKRAHMTRPTEPLWRMAIPLKPTEKSYRPTHRALGSRGCVAWDTSYLSTIGCHGTDLALENTLKSLGFRSEVWTGAMYKKWKAGSRFAESWMYEYDNDKGAIAPVTVLWQHHQQPPSSGKSLQPRPAQDAELQDIPEKSRSKKAKLDKRLKLLVHPSAFHHLWAELMKVAKMQKPHVLLEDLRFEIGSILVQGPGSTEALAGVLKTVEKESSAAKAWAILAGLSNPSSLPLNATLAIDITDPRLCHPPKQVTVGRNETTINELNQILVSWPPDQGPGSSALFSHKARYASARSMLSQKAINRRQDTILPGQTLPSLGTDPSIPVVLLARRSPCGSSGAQGSWTVLMPWSAVDPVWRTLMYYPLSAGEAPRFGGLEQTQQVAFEQFCPWFPGDYPGTDAGKAWDRTQTERSFDSWIQRPPSRRYAWDTLDLGLGRRGELGRGWACDWEFLLLDAMPLVKLDGTIQNSQEQLANREIATPRCLTQRQRKAKAAEVDRGKTDRRRNTSSPESGAEDEMLKPVNFSQLSPMRARSVFQNVKTTKLPRVDSLATIRIKLLTRGTPSRAARIYRLPNSHASFQELTVSFDQSDEKRATSHRDGHTSTVDQPPSSGQPPMHLFSTEPQSNSKPSSSELRQRWLSLDRNPAAVEDNPSSSTALAKQQKKLRSNRYNDPRVGGRHYPLESLDHIRVFPPNAPKEVKEMYGPPPARKAHQQLVEESMPVPNTMHGFLEDENVWEKKHIPCPDPHDLIGFVTSGGYNLAEGRGTAIGAIWVQKVIEGWRCQDLKAQAQQPQEKQADNTATGNTDQNVPVEGPNVPGMKTTAVPKQKTPGARVQQDVQTKRTAAKLEKQYDRERHLCIVRNAGESVGRLGIWELC